MYQVRPKKKLGQHFLINMQIAQRIADTVDVSPYADLPILEVGPGTGALSQYLLPKQRPYKAVELDGESIIYLNEHFPAMRKSLIDGDFLQMDLNKVFDGKPFVLTGNYPYNISSQIFFKLLDYKELIPCCTGMIQKEVAERLTSPPGSRDYGILSVFLSAYYRTEYLFTVDENVFNPPPKVKSAVIRFTRNEVKSLDCDEKLFKRVVKTLFNQRRKMMRGSIKPLLADLDNQYHPVDHTALLNDSMLTLRPEKLGVDEFVTLTNRLLAEYK